MGVKVQRGDPKDNKPGQRIVIPEHPSQVAVTDVELDQVRRSYLHHAIESLSEGDHLSDVDIDFLVAETRSSKTYVQESINELR
jgi:hypothetical protein